MELTQRELTVRPQAPRVAIVDYGLGNLYSVARACQRVGLDVHITDQQREILASPCVILPGVGAFGDAMANLRRRDLIEPLRDIARSGKLLLGICLGLQLLMSESEEFGQHRGLDIIRGKVLHFGRPRESNGMLKVPQVGWNRIWHPRDCRPEAGADDPWRNSPLQQIANGTHMYFVHSYYVIPDDSSVELSTTRYGDVQFTSALKQDNIMAFQYHPERSGPDGIQIYQDIASAIRRGSWIKEERDAA